MIKILGFVIARQSEINIIELSQYHAGYEDGTNDVLNDMNLKLSQVRISPRTGLPVRKYTKRK